MNLDKEVILFLSPQRVLASECIGKSAALVSMVVNFLGLLLFILIVNFFLHSALMYFFLQENLLKCRGYYRLAIFMVLFLSGLLIHASYNTYVQINKGDTSLEQSKVCMAKFKSKNCDALSPTPPPPLPTASGYFPTFNAQKGLIRL
jgi:hypothetical protein